MPRHPLSDGARAAEHHRGARTAREVEMPSCSHDSGGRRGVRSRRIDEARVDGRRLLYGALGVGGTKMKIHRAAIGRIFEPPATCLDAEDLLAIGESLR